MSTQARGPTMLPEVYQIYIPQDRTNCRGKEFNELIAKASPGCTSGGGCSGSWHKIQSTGYEYRQDKYPSIPEISYENWKQAILGTDKSTVHQYKVGDYVVITEYEGGWPVDSVHQITEDQGSGHYKLGKYVQDDICMRPATPEEIAKATGQPVANSHVQVGQWVWPLAESGYGKRGYGHGRKLGRAYKIWQIESDWVRMETAEGRQDSGNGAIHRDDVRPATQAEIDIAQGKVQDGWVVGMELPLDWLNKQVWYGAPEITKQHSPGGFSSPERKVDKIEKGWVHISGAANCYLAPDQYQDYKRYMSGGTTAQVPVIASNNSTTVKEKKTMEDWKGTRVRVINYGEYNGLGTVIYAAETEDVQRPRCFTVQMDDGRTCSPYTPWATSPQCEIVSSTTVSETKSITIKNQKQDEHSKQQSKSTGTAVNLSANPSTVCRADRRTATPVRQSGYSLLTVRGHRGHSQAVRVNKEVQSYTATV